MKIKELKRNEALKTYEKISSGNIPLNFFNDLDEDYKKIREDFKKLVPNPIESTYEFDLKLAIITHKYFSKDNIDLFNLAVASNYDFWRYICLKVLPDIIIKRHGTQPEYFFSKNVRLYFSTLWWYIEMFWQGDDDSTFKALQNFNTDYILNFVERPGRDGMYVEINREILRCLNLLPKEIINSKIGGQTLMRRVLIQNTARINDYNLVIENKAKDYVLNLFLDCGVDVKKYEK